MHTSGVLHYTSAHLLRHCWSMLCVLAPSHLSRLSITIAYTHVKHYLSHACTTPTLSCFSVSFRSRSVRSVDTISPRCCHPLATIAVRHSVLSSLDRFLSRGHATSSTMDPSIARATAGTGTRRYPSHGRTHAALPTTTLTIVIRDLLSLRIRCHASTVVAVLSAMSSSRDATICIFLSRTQVLMYVSPPCAQ